MNYRNPNILCAGNVNLDLSPRFADPSQHSVEELFLPGRIVKMNGMELHAGGSVSNTGGALKKMGANVTCTAMTGDDKLGELLRNLLAQNGMDKGIITRPGERTSFSVVLAPPGIDRIFLHDQGANGSLCGGDVPDSAFDGVQLMHFGYPMCMRSFFIDDGEALARLFSRARNRGVAVSLDTCAVEPSGEAANVNWELLLKCAAPATDICFPSADELAYMLEPSLCAKWLAKDHHDPAMAIDISNDIPPLADKLIGWGARIVIIKCGVRGIYLKAAEESALESCLLPIDKAAWAGKELFCDSFVPEKVVSAVGAGDVTIAAFLMAVMAGFGPSDCLRLGAAAGAKCVENVTSLGGVKPLDELMADINSGWASNRQELGDGWRFVPDIGIHERAWRLWNKKEKLNV